MSLERVFTTTLTSPGGQVKLNLTCSQCCTDIPHCTALLPNGKTIPEADQSSWSPDERFAVICMNSFHDKPCGWYEVWDMVDGVQKGELPDPYYSWNARADHQLVYVTRSQNIGVNDQLVIFDPASGEKAFPKSCPAWFQSKFPDPCNGVLFPPLVIGGQLSGLSHGARVEIVVRQPPDQQSISLGGYQGNDPWECPVPSNLWGVTYTITAEAKKYRSDPISYTIQLSGTQVYTLIAGHLVADEATHLDFHFTPVK